LFKYLSTQTNTKGTDY